VIIGEDDVPGVGLLSVDETVGRENSAPPERNTARISLNEALTHMWHQVWHNTTGTALGRERRYVRRGIRSYKRSVGSGTDLYLLRRNAHPIEKGLTMRPVRNQFATDYIGETVDAFNGGLTSGVLAPEHPSSNGFTRSCRRISR
jgi:hypothetical protein